MIRLFVVLASAISVVVTVFVAVGVSREPLLLPAGVSVGIYLSACIEYLWGELA